MEQLFSCVTSDASVFGVAPVFLGPFTRMLHAEFSDRLAQAIIPLLREQRMRTKRTTAEGLFDPNAPDRYAARLCEFSEIEKDFSASVPYEWYLDVFRERLPEYDSLAPVVHAYQAVRGDWDFYRHQLSVALGEDERRIIQLEERLGTFQDVFRTIRTGEIFSNRYVQRVRQRASFQTHMTIEHRTLGYPNGPWIPPQRDMKDKANDKELVPRKGDIVPFAVNAVTVLTRQFVCTRLHELSTDDWRRRCDQFFSLAQKHADLAQHLADATLVDRETERDLHLLLFNPRTGSLKFDKEDDAAYGMHELQPCYASVHGALVKVYALTFDRAPSSSGHHKLGSTPITDAVHRSIEKCGYQQLREQMTAFRARMDKRRATETCSVDVSAVVASWLRLRSSTYVEATPVSTTVLETFTKRSTDFFMGTVQKSLFERHGDSKKASMMMKSVGDAAAKLREKQLVFLRDLLDHMVLEVDVLWCLFELADTLDASSPPLPPPPPRGAS